MPEGNLDQDPREWAQHMFEDEYCAECGGDENDHDIIAVNGNWFARCKPLRKVRATVTVEVDIGHRVDPERAREVIAAYAEHGSLIEGVYAAFEGADVLISEARVVPADNGDSVKSTESAPFTPDRSLQFTVEAVKDNRGAEIIAEAGVTDQALTEAIETFFDSAAGRRDVDFLYDAYDNACSTILAFASDPDEFLDDGEFTDD